jgi:hypothetical protein
MNWLMKDEITRAAQFAIKQTTEEPLPCFFLVDIDLFKKP